MTSLDLFLDSPNPQPKRVALDVEGLADVLNRHTLLHQSKRVRFRLGEPEGTV